VEARQAWLRVVVWLWDLGARKKADAAVAEALGQLGATNLTQMGEAAQTTRDSLVFAKKAMDEVGAAGLLTPQRAGHLLQGMSFTEREPSADPVVRERDLAEQERHAAIWALPWPRACWPNCWEAMASRGDDATTLAAAERFPLPRGELFRIAELIVRQSGSFMGRGEGPAKNAVMAIAKIARFEADELTDLMELAAEQGWSESVAELVAAGADPLGCGRRGSPAALAVERAQWPLAKALDDAGGWSDQADEAVLSRSETGVAEVSGWAWQARLRAKSREEARNIQRSLESDFPDLSEPNAPASETGNRASAAAVSRRL
jgi:hypothetical protein